MTALERPGLTAPAVATPSARSCPSTEPESPGLDDDDAPGDLLVREPAQPCQDGRVECPTAQSVDDRGHSCGRAPELTLDGVGRVGLPRYPVANVDGSALVKAEDPVVGAHRDIHHREIATLVLLAGRLLEGGPDGIRPPRRAPRARA
jgi:hypothetical protein